MELTLRVWIGLGVLLGSFMVPVPYRQAAAQNWEVPAEVRQKAERLLRLAGLREGCRSDDLNTRHVFDEDGSCQKVDTISEKFDAALGDLTGRLSAQVLAEAQAREGNDLVAKMIVLASFRSQHADRIDEIMEKYVLRPGIPRHSRRYAPSPYWFVDQDHRLAWEYLLFRPAGSAWWPRYDYSAVEALDLLRREESLLTLLFYFDPKIPATADNVKPAIFYGILDYFPSAAGLQALFQCMDARAIPDAQEQEIAGFMARLSGRNRAVAQEWLQVFETYLGQEGKPRKDVVQRWVQALRGSPPAK